ncbi:hypothetical protein ACFFRR_004278 [Megaselia abdita]
MKVFAFLLLSTLSILSVQGKIYSKCELARTLSQNGIPRSELPDWVCLVQAESNYNTKATNTNTNKTKDWGIFQINDKWWCKPSDGRFSYNECNLNCDRDLLSDDITKATTCAKKIKGRQGFKAWYGWQNKCQGKKLPSVNECF